MKRGFVVGVVAAVGVLAVALLAQSHGQKGQKQKLEIKELVNLDPGAYKVRVAEEGGKKIIFVMTSSPLERDYTHMGVNPKTKKACNGAVVVGSQLTDDGMTTMKCGLCGKVWRIRVGEPMK